jgi:thioredoxin 1
MTVRSWAIVVVLLALVAGAVVAKKTVLAPKPDSSKPDLAAVGSARKAEHMSGGSAYPGPAEAAPASSGIPKKALAGPQLQKCLSSGKPTLVDFGAGWCEQCKLEAPVLDAAVEKYRGKANVVFVDTNRYEPIARQYGIKLIPTQIFFDAKGKEVGRHVGFHPAEAVAADLAKAGVRADKAGVK